MVIRMAVLNQKQQNTPTKQTTKTSRLLTLHRSALCVRVFGSVEWISYSKQYHLLIGNYSTLVILSYCDGVHSITTPVTILKGELFREQDRLFVFFFVLFVLVCLFVFCFFFYSCCCCLCQLRAFLLLFSRPCFRIRVCSVAWCVCVEFEREFVYCDTRCSAYIHIYIASVCHCVLLLPLLLSSSLVVVVVTVFLCARPHTQCVCWFAPCFSTWTHYLEPAPLKPITTRTQIRTHLKTHSQT